MKKVEKDKRNLVQSEWKKIARSEENVKILHTEDDDSQRPAGIGHFPMFIDLWKKKIVVVGAGTIAQRRIRTLLLFGADIWVAAPMALEEAIGLAETFEAGEIIVYGEDQEPFRIEKQRECIVGDPWTYADRGQKNSENVDQTNYEEIGQINDEARGQMKILCKPYDASLCEGAFMVLAATDDEMLNAAICRDGKMAGAYVNNASDHHQCDFYFPSVVKQEDHVVGINGGGQDHRGTKLLRQKIEEVLEVEKG